MDITLSKSTEFSLTVEKAADIVVNITPQPDVTVIIDRGVSGKPGTNGQGVPIGGITGQALIKGSNTDFDMIWHMFGTMADQNDNSVDITGGVVQGLTNLQSDYLQIDTAIATAIALGKLRWNPTTNTLSFGIIDGTIECNVGEQMYAYVTNADAVTILKGQPVYLYSATGNRASVRLASNLGDSTSAKTLGLATQDIAPNQVGFVTTQGVLDKINTSAFNEGDTLYLGATSGTLTATKPKAPNHLVYIGVVERANNGNGQIYIRPQNGYELDELHDVLITNPQDEDVLTYESATSLWKNKPSSGGGTPFMITTLIDSTTGTYYYGGLLNGAWKINKYVDPLMTKSSATIANNPTYATLSAAWADRLTLIYG